MKSLLDDLNLGRLLQGGIQDQRDARDIREAMDLLEKERGLLRDLQVILEKKSVDPGIRAAYDRCAVLRKAERWNIALRSRADTIYNAYYTRDGIRNGLLALEEYAMSDAEDIDDPDSLYMKIYTDRLRILRFLYDRMIERVTGLLPDETEEETPETVTEKELEPFGWIPVEQSIRRAIQKLRTCLERKKQQGAGFSNELREMSNNWEENRAALEQNIRRLKGPLPKPESGIKTTGEEALLEAMTRVLTGEIFDGLTQKAVTVDEYMEKVQGFISHSRAVLLDPFERT